MPFWSLGQNKVEMKDVGQGGHASFLAGNCIFKWFWTQKSMFGNSSGMSNTPFLVGRHVGIGQAGDKVVDIGKGPS